MLTQFRDTAKTRGVWVGLQPGRNSRILFVMGFPRFLRSLLPSWRFFDDSGAAFRLWARTGPDEAHWGPWVEVLTPPPRGWRSLLLNPEGNLFHARATLIGDLLHELQSASPSDMVMEDNVPYQLVDNWVRTHFLNLEKNPESLVQFRISVFPPTRPDLSEDIVLSPVRKIGDPRT